MNKQENDTIDIDRIITFMLIIFVLGFILYLGYSYLITPKSITGNIPIIQNGNINTTFVNNSLTGYLTSYRQAGNIIFTQITSDTNPNHTYLNINLDKYTTKILSDSYNQRTIIKIDYIPRENFNGEFVIIKAAVVN